MPPVLAGQAADLRHAAPGQVGARGSAGVEVTAMRRVSIRPMGFPGGMHASEDGDTRILARTVAASLPATVPEPPGVAVRLSGILGLCGIGRLRRGGDRLSMKGGASRCVQRDVLPILVPR